MGGNESKDNQTLRGFSLRVLFGFICIIHRQDTSIQFICVLIVLILKLWLWQSLPAISPHSAPLLPLSFTCRLHLPPSFHHLTYPAWKTEYNARIRGISESMTPQQCDRHRSYSFSGLLYF